MLTVKRVFGSWWSRLIRGGTKLSRLEFAFVLLLIDALPERPAADRER